MNKTKIEWCDYTVNPVKGLCPMACSYCYARRMYKRYQWDETIRFEASAFDELRTLRLKSSRIFVGSTMELFGDWVSHSAMRYILDTCLFNPQHTFIFLTKRPENLQKWSPFPKNCWVGVSCVDKLHFLAAMHHMGNISASVKFISFEPILERMDTLQSIEEHLRNGGISWVILGQQTPASAKTEPKVEWLKEIVDAAGEAKVPVFLKNNLASLFGNMRPESDIAWACTKECGYYCDEDHGHIDHHLRQELPRVDV